MGRSEERMSQLVGKSVTSREALALKVLRNVCQHGRAVVHQLMIPYLDALTSLITVSDPISALTAFHQCHQLFLEIILG